MLLLNTSKKPIEAKFDGVITSFGPREKKRVDSRTQGDHILFKLQPYGLVELPDTVEFLTAKDDSKTVEPYLIRGMRERRKMLDKVVQNFRTMNKEREAAKLAADIPGDYVIACVKEIKEIDELLKALKADDIKAVDDYLQSNHEAVADASRDIADMAGSVNRDGASGYRVTGRNGNGEKPPTASPQRNGNTGGARKPANTRR